MTRHKEYITDNFLNAFTIQAVHCIYRTFVCKRKKINIFLNLKVVYYCRNFVRERVIYKCHKFSFSSDLLNVKKKNNNVTMTVFIILFSKYFKKFKVCSYEHKENFIKRKNYYFRKMKNFKFIFKLNP